MSGNREIRMHLRLAMELGSWVWGWIWVWIWISEAARVLAKIVNMGLVERAGVSRGGGARDNHRELISGDLTMLARVP